jgi:hypothetical protein
VAHLRFQVGQRIVGRIGDHVPDPALLVGRRDRLGPQHLAARGVQQHHRRGLAHGLQGEPHPLTAIVLFGHDAVGVERLDHPPAPTLGRKPAGPVAQHIAPPIDAQAGDHDALSVALIFAAGSRRVDRDHDPLEIRRGRDAAAVDRFVRPEGAGDVEVRRAVPDGPGARPRNAR